MTPDFSRFLIFEMKQIVFDGRVQIGWPARQGRVIRRGGGGADDAWFEVSAAERGPYIIIQRVKNIVVEQTVFKTDDDGPLGSIIKQRERNARMIPTTTTTTDASRV